jgi:HlyD family secretion protein
MGELAARWRVRRWWWAAPAVVGLLAYGVVRALTAGADATPKPPATATADRGPVTTEVATTGTVRPAQTRGLSFTVAGTVTDVRVRPGTMVTPGQVLAAVDDAAATAAVNTADKALRDAETALTAARNAGTATPSTGCAGANVAAGYHPPAPAPAGTPTTTATPRPTPTTAPAPTHSVPGTTAPRTTAPRPTAPRTTGPAPGGPRTTAPGGRPTAGSSGCPSTSTGQAGGGNQGRDAGGDPILSARQRVNQATATLANAEAALDGATITAPMAGKILTVTGPVGGQVSAGATFITLADVNAMQITATFPEADADHLAERQTAVVSLADRPGTTFPATVIQVDPVGTLDGTMVRYGVLFSFTKAPTDLLVGQSANVRVTTGAAAEVLRVPSTAVHDVSNGNGTVLRPAGRVSVGVGLRGDQYTQITSGLDAGDIVTRSW